MKVNPAPFLRDTSIRLIDCEINYPITPELRTECIIRCYITKLGELGPWRINCSLVQLKRVRID